MMMKAFFLILFCFITVNLYSQDIVTIKNKYLDGVSALANNNITAAGSNFNYIISTPESAPLATFLTKYKSKSYYFLGDVYFIREDYSNAMECYRKVVQKYYNEDIYTKSLYKLGRTLVLAMRYEEGISMLKDYAAKYGNKDSMGDNAIYWIGRGYAMRGDYVEALNSFNLVLEKYPNTTLSYEIRNSIDAVNKLIDNQNKQKNLPSDVDTIKLKNEKIGKEKEVLAKMAKLLQIKQRLLEIKSEKVELLSRLKENNEGQW